MAKKVKLFALSTCVHCRNTKKFLDEKDIEYDCVYVDTLEGDERKDTIDEVKKWNKACSFPTIVIDDESVIVGFKKKEIEEVLGL